MLDNQHPPLPGFGFEFWSHWPKRNFLEKKLPDWYWVQSKTTKAKWVFLANHFDQATRSYQAGRNDANGSVTRAKYRFYPSEKASESSNRITACQLCLRRRFHLVIREKLNNFLDPSGRKSGKISDGHSWNSAPVMEPSMGRKSGIGWIGKKQPVFDRMGTKGLKAKILLEKEWAIFSPLHILKSFLSRVIKKSFIGFQQ